MSFNQIIYSRNQIKNKYKEYYDQELYGTFSSKFDEAKFLSIWKFREKGLSYVDVSKKTNIGEGTVRRVIRFLEQEESIIKGLLAGYTIEKLTDQDNQSSLARESKETRSLMKESYHNKTRPSGSKVKLSNDQILFFIKNVEEKSFRDIAKALIIKEGTLDETDEGNVELINERIKNLNDRLQGKYIEARKDKNGKTIKDKNGNLIKDKFIDPDQLIKQRVNEAIKSGYIKYSDGSKFNTQYNYVELTGPEKEAVISFSSAKPWVERMLELMNEGTSASRRLEKALRGEGYEVGKTSILKYQATIEIISELVKEGIKSPGRIAKIMKKNDPIKFKRVSEVLIQKWIDSGFIKSIKK